MKPEVLILISNDELGTKAAVLEGKNLVEFYTEQQDKESLVGRIYKGKVRNIVKGLKGAFVILGLKKNGFLPLAEFFEEEAEIFEPKLELIETKEKKRVPTPVKIDLQPDAEILCQVVKDPMGEKGARLTSFISFPGRYLVYFPTTERIGVSRRIEERKERARLREIAKRLKKPETGLIVRTAATGVPFEDLLKEYQYLEATSVKILEKAKTVAAPCLLYEEPDFANRVVRDLALPNIKGIVVDDPELYSEIVKYLQTIAPEIKSRVTLHNQKEPLFKFYKIEEEIKKIFERKIWLKSGGFITIDQTEALVAIDVNTGRSAQEEDPERLILSTNLEAAGEIARQIRLRDLSGLIIIDFIDMKEPKNIELVVEELKLCLENDKAKSDFARVSRFGILEMTRERIRSGLLSTLYEPCPTCKSLGRIYSRRDTALRIQKTLESRIDELKGKRVKITTSPIVAEFLGQVWTEKLENFVKKYNLTIEIKPDQQIELTKFRIFTEI